MSTHPHTAQAWRETVISVNGSRDGIRFGEVQFSEGARRRYYFDRFTGRVQLAHMGTDKSFRPKVDRDPQRLADAQRILTAHIGLVG